MAIRPHQIFGNTPRRINYAVEGVGDLIEPGQKPGIKRVEATL